MFLKKRASISLILLIIVSLSCSDNTTNSINNIIFADATQTACNYNTSGDGAVKTGNISGTVSWGAQGPCIQISGYVKVQDGAVLTIPKGSTILADTNNATVLVIEQGGKLMAEGTATEPLIFTSGKAVGERTRGDWGGITINGKSQYNKGEKDDGSNIGSGEGSTGSYGGASDKTGSSGSLKYVRIEFSGRKFNVENELNGLSLQAVGSGTILENIHVHNNADDGIEIFGGTVSITNLISTINGDDQLDWTNGWEGSITQAILIPIKGNTAIEADNDKDNNNKTPISHGTLDKVVAIVSKSSDNNNEQGLHFRGGTKVTASNLYVGGFDLCVDQKDNPGKLSLGTIRIQSCRIFSEGGTEPSKNTVMGLIPSDLTEDKLKDKISPILIATIGEDIISWTEFPIN